MKLVDGIPAHDPHGCSSFRRHIQAIDETAAVGQELRPDHPSTVAFGIVTGVEPVAAHVLKEFVFHIDSGLLDAPIPNRKVSCVSHSLFVRNHVAPIVQQLLGSFDIVDYVQRVGSRGVQVLVESDRRPCRKGRMLCLDIARKAVRQNASTSSGSYGCLKRITKCCE